jgi:hypothetical protein
MPSLSSPTDVEIAVAQRYSAGAQEVQPALGAASVVHADEQHLGCGGHGGSLGGGGVQAVTIGGHRGGMGVGAALNQRRPTSAT